MGVDFTALMDHKCSLSELLALPEDIEQGWQTYQQQWAAAVPELLPESKNRWEWSRDVIYGSLEEQFRDGRYLTLDGPLAFSLIFGTRLFEVYHWTRWPGFLTEQDVRELLRRTCFYFGRTLGASKVIYLPDSEFGVSGAHDFLWDGKTMEDVETWLQTNCGPPAAHIPDIYTEHNGIYEADGYYVEPLPEQSR